MGVGAKEREHEVHAAVRLRQRPVCRSAGSRTDGAAAVTDLVGAHVRLRVMEPSDATALVRAASDGELWKVPYTEVPTIETIEDYIATAKAAQAAGTCLPLVIELRSTGEVVGATRLMDASLANRSLEARNTWLAASHQGTLVNTEQLYLKLKFAFEDLCCIRVQFRVDELNAKSRRSCERMGAKLEGLLRNARIMPDGRICNIAVYSMIDEEWPAARHRCEQRLGIA